MSPQTEVAGSGLLPVGRVKHCREDFVVTECALLVPSDAGEYVGYVLRKEGLTTFAALDMIAEAWDCPVDEIGYAGLKDEDGVTEQSVTLPRPRVEQGALKRLSLSSSDGELSLEQTGPVRYPLAVGDLVGNVFRVQVRDLPTGVADALRTVCSEDQTFLNYYDVQRFGVAEGPKTSHLIGAALLRGDHPEALRLLVDARVPESEAARSWDGDPAEFFERFDPRKSAFYLCSHESHLWNARLSSEFESTASSIVVSPHEGIRFGLAMSPRDVRRFAADTPSLPIIKHRSVQGHVEASDSRRTAVVQLRCAVVLQADTCFPQRVMAELRFFLPSGCYATMAVRSLLAYATSIG